jgi:outer membrane protein OmpA-like peptidoglycan-associated protein
VTQALQLAARTGEAPSRASFGASQVKEIAKPGRRCKAGEGVINREATSTMKWILPWAGWLLLATGCSSTLVVLVPDPNGKVGKVTVTTEGGQQTLAKAGQSTEAGGLGEAPGALEILSQQTIRSLFRVALDNEPAPPLHYLLFFHLDTTRLMPASRRHLPEVVRAIRARGSCDISVIGHTDRLGEEDYNEDLSRRRAEQVKAALVSLGVPDTCMDVRYYGESDPLIPTPDEVAEPRNRRVQIEIR